MRKVNKELSNSYPHYCLSFGATTLFIRLFCMLIISQDYASKQLKASINVLHCY